MTKYYFAGAERIALSIPTGTVSLLLGDHLGSTSVTARTSGALVGTMRYAPWGGLRYSSGATPTKYHFTGQREESPIRLY